MTNRNADDGSGCMALCRKTLLERASRLARGSPAAVTAEEQKEEERKGGSGGGGSGSSDLGGQTSERDDEDFNGDVEPIRDDNVSVSGELMSVGRALQDVPEYLRPFAKGEQPRRRLKDVCFANHPDRLRTHFGSYANARAASVGTAAPGTPLVDGAAAPSGSSMAHDEEGTRARSGAVGRTTSRGRRVEGRLSGGAAEEKEDEKTGAEGMQERGSLRGADRSGLQCQDWAECLPIRTQPATSTRMQSQLSGQRRSGAGLDIQLSGQRRSGLNGSTDWAESPTSASSHGRRQSGVELGRRRSSWRSGSGDDEPHPAGNSSGTSGRSREVNRADSLEGNFGQHLNMASPHPRAVPPASEPALRAVTPIPETAADQQSPSDRRTDRRGLESRKDEQACRADDHAMDNEDEEMAEDVETVGEGHTEELQRPVPH